MTKVQNGGFAGESLRALASRIERLEEDKATIAEDIKEVYAEAKALGFDAKIIRKCIKERKMEPQARAEQMELFDIYMHAIEGTAEASLSVVGGNESG